MPLQVWWQGEEWGRNFIFFGRQSLGFGVFLEFPGDLAGCVHMEAHTALSTTGEVPVTELPLLPEVKVSAMETVMQYRIAGS